MEKIRTLVAHNDINITNGILKAIDQLDYVEVIGTATNGKETYSKIIDLQPDIVFTEYNMDQMESLDIIIKSKEKLENSVPVFNFITNKSIEDTELKQAIHILGNKMNSLVSEPINDIILYILKEYKRKQVSK